MRLITAPPTLMIGHQSLACSHSASLLNMSSTPNVEAAGPSSVSLANLSAHVDLFSTCLPQRPGGLLGCYPALQVTQPSDISTAARLVFPGVGAFEQCMGTLERSGYVQPLKDYIQVRAAEQSLISCGAEVGNPA